jgi:hypothetical protein
LFFLLTQSLAVGLLFFLAYPDATRRPAWMAFLISIGFHLAGALAIHFYITFPIALGTPRQRRRLLIAVYTLMFVALACRLSGTDWGLRATFFYNTLEVIGAVAILVYAYARATPDARRRLRPRFPRFSSICSPQSSARTVSPIGRLVPSSSFRRSVIS